MESSSKLFGLFNYYRAFNFYKYIHARSEKKSEFSFNLRKKKKIGYSILHGAILPVFISLLIFEIIRLFSIPSLNFHTVSDELTSRSITIMGVLICGIVLSIAFLGGLLSEMLKAPNLLNFSLILQKNYVELNGQQVKQPLTGKIRITKGGDSPSPFTNTKLELEGDIENALLEVTEFVKRRSYLVKRELAESLSRHLQIPFHDDFSSFDEEIYAKKSYLKRLETIEVLKPDFPERFELHTVENSRIILFPTFINKPAVIILSVTAIILTAGFVLLLFLNNSNTIIVLIVAVLYVFLMLFILLFAIFFIRNTSKDRITLNDDSIMLTRRHLWGTSEVFVSSLEELQEVTTFPYSTSALLLFRSVKNIRFTSPHQEQDIIQIFHFLNRFLLEKAIEVQ